MSEIGEVPVPQTPLLDKLNDRLVEIEVKTGRPTVPKKMLFSVQRVMGLSEADAFQMFGETDPDKLTDSLKKGGANHDTLRHGYLTSNFLMFNVKPNYTPEAWTEYVNHPSGEFGGRSLSEMFKSGDYEEILQHFEPKEEEIAA